MSLFKNQRTIPKPIESFPQTEDFLLKLKIESAKWNVPEDLSLKDRLKLSVVMLALRVGGAEYNERELLMYAAPDILEASFLRLMCMVFGGGKKLRREIERELKKRYNSR